MSSGRDRDAKSGVIPTFRAGQEQLDGPTRVLVIDDSPAARAKMVDVLEPAGFAVFELASAIGATRILMRNDIAAVVADVSMPGLSGDKLVGVLRQNPRLRDLAIVIVSGTHEEHLKDIQLSREVDATLSKREIDAKLASTVQRALLGRGVSFSRRQVVAS